MLAFVNMLPDPKSINISIVVTFPVSLQHQVSSLIPAQKWSIIIHECFCVALDLNEQGFAGA
jgi:hypothetical protein